LRRGRSKQGRRAHDVAVYAPSGSLYYGEKRDYMGGAEVQATKLAHALKAKGLRVAHVVYPVPKPALVDASSPTLVERPNWQGFGPRGQLAETRAIWSSLERADAEAYIVRGSGGHVIPAGAFCRMRGRRFVFSSSSELDFDFARPDRNRRMLQLYKASLSLAARLALQTEQQRELALRVLPKSDPVVIPSFAESAPSMNGTGEYFLWADRLVEYKLPERYLELAAALPEARFRMVACEMAETAPGMAEQIEAAAKRLPNVELLPPRPRSELLAEMQNAVAVVKTSRVEGMPNTFLEAWARGVPVLSLNVDPDAKIANNDIGVAADGSMELLIDAAASLWRDRQLRAEMGERARRFIQDVHSPEAVADRWVALLEGLI
jgi:glycosyltransferase involved in cell wall biosynthesis